LIIDTIKKLRSGEADIAFPYNGEFYDTSEIIRTLFIRKKQIQILHKNKDRMMLVYGDKHIGGAFIANTDKYKQTGMENENFYGWGPEDFERYSRWINLGFKIYRASGCMYHLSHPRDMNGGFASQRQREITTSEYVKTKNSSYNELLKLNEENTFIGTL